MTVKSGASRVGHLYAIWPLPRGGGLQYENKMEFLSQANLDVSHALFVPLSWSAPRSGFTSLLFDVQLNRQKYFFPKHERKATSISEFEKKWDHL